MKNILNIISYLSLIVVILTLSPTSAHGFKYLAFLPIATISFIHLFKHRLIQYKNSIVLVLFLIQVIIRYLLLPLLMTFDLRLEIIGSSAYRGYTIFFMILELFISLLSFSIYGKRYLHANKTQVNTIDLMYPDFVSIVIMFILITFIIATGYFSKVNYIWNLDSYILNRDEFEHTSTLAGVLFTPFRLITSLIVISYVYNKQFNRKVTFIILFFVLFLNSIIIVGTSRFSIILSILPLITVMYSLFKNVRKTLLLGFLTMVIIAITVTTINKFSLSKEQDNINFVNSNSLNVYFSGPGNESKGVELYYSRDNWDRIEFLISDCIQNIPILSKSSKELYKTNLYFNESIYGHRLYQDQIVPLSLNGLIHFGVVGPLMYPFFFISLALFFERRFITTNKIGYKLVFVTLAINLSLIFMLNIGSLFLAIFSNLVFLLIPIITINLLSKKNKSQNSF